MDLFNLYSDLVCKNIEYKPNVSFNLLKAGYWLEGNVLSKFKEKDFLNSQKYLSKISMDFVLEPMQHSSNAALVNIFTPCEFLHAMDIYPQFIEAFSSYLSGAGCESAFIDFAEKEGISDNFCSYHKAFLGAATSKVLPAPKCAITTSLACDANINTFRAISKECGINKYVIDVPYEYSKDAEEYVEMQLKEMVSFLEDNFNRKLNEDNLKKIILNENKSIDYYKKFLDKLAYKYYPNTLTLEMYRIFATHAFLGHDKVLEYYRLLLEDIDKCNEVKGNRILWTHLIPFYSEPLREIFNLNEDNQLVICDFNFDSLIQLDADKPYKSIAKKLILNHFNGGYDRKVDNILKMCNKLKIDGVVHLCHVGCKQSFGGAYILKEKLESNNIKTLIIDGDGIDKRNGNDEQIRTRMEAFLDIIEKEKRHDRICL